MAENQLANFSFDGALVRTVVLPNGQPGFVGKDVCQAFGDADHKRSLSRLDEDERFAVVVIDRMGRQQLATALNESGLYSLLFAMQPEKAGHDGEQDVPPHILERVQRLRKFRKWITAEVLPAIRKTGRYEAPAAAPAEVAPQQVQALAIALEARTAEVAQLQVQLIGAQGAHIKTLTRFNALQRRFEAREARNMIIDMARLGHSREAIAAATGRKFNHIRQVIFQAKRAGVLARDAETTQAGFDFGITAALKEIGHA